MELIRLVGLIVVFLFGMVVGMFLEGREHE